MRRRVEGAGDEDVEVRDDGQVRDGLRVPRDATLEPCALLVDTRELQLQGQRQTARDEQVSVESKCANAHEMQF